MNQSAGEILMNEAVVTQSLVEYLFSQPETSVYAVLDGASVEQLPQLLWEYEPEHVCLYLGELEPDMAAVAPYLVKLQYDHRFTKLLCRKGWGHHWGIFVLTPAQVDLGDLRKHFRKFLMIPDPEGKLFYFRYYDPRVLRLYLPTCNNDEVQTFFGHVRNFLEEDEDGKQLMEYYLTDSKLAMRSVRIEGLQ